MKAFSFSSILKNFGKQLSSLASQMPWCNLRFNLGSISVLSRVNPLFSRRASHFAAILTILFTIGVGNMWGEIIDLTPNATITIENKKWKEVGGGYVSRNGSSTTVYTDGLTTGGGNTYVVFDVAVPSTIEAKFINVSTSGYENEPVLCGKVSDTQWSAIESAVSAGTQYQLSIENANKLTAGSITLSKNNQNGTTSCSFTATAAGKYAVYWTSSINNNVRLYEIQITAAQEPECGSTAQTLSLSSNSGTICGTGTTTFTVSGGSGTGELSVTSSDPTKATATINGTTVTVTGVAAGNATITVTKACDATYAEATATYSVTVAAIPTANAGADKTTEPDNDVALAATAAASGCTGAWTIQSGPNTSTAQLSSTSSATAIFTPTVAGTYTLRWTVTNTSSSCSAYDEMTVSAVVCSISECGNATITYAINGGSSGDHATGGTDLISSATANNTTALGASTTVGYTGISMSSLAKKAAAAISACYPTKPNMSGKIGVYNGAAYNSSNYLQFAFTVKTGYTFTPCDIEFTVQPVDVATNFRWEVTDGTNVYGYGTATDVPKGSDGGASVLTGLTSTAEMAAGTYYIRLYPYVNAASKTFRISNNVILKGTTAAAACAAPTNVTIDGAWDKFGGETISLTATATGGSGNYTYQWQKKIGENWENITDNATATTANLVYENCDGSHSGTYRCVVSTGADCSTASNGLQVKVYTLECYNNGTNIYHFTRNGNTQSGTLTLNLNANTAYEFKVHVDNTYYGNNGTINKDETNWVMCNSDNGGACANNLTVNSGLGGTFTFGIEYSTGGNSSVEGEPEISVTYPRKTIYLEPNSDWLSNSAKFAYYYFHKTGDDTDAEGWTDFLTADDCGRYADIPQWNGVQMIAVRFNSSKASTGNWNDKWNQTSDLTVTSNDLITITGWDNSQTYNSTYSTPTYTISYAAGSTTATGGAAISGSKAAETKTCGVDFTLPSSAVFTATGYTQVGWSTTDGGAQTHALGGSYTGNAAQTFYPVWEEEECEPTVASITFNNNVAGKYNTNWGDGDITTSGGATYTLTNTSCDTGHPMTKPAIKGTKNKTLIQINIPAGATSGTISVSAATYSGGGATLAITNSSGTVLASQSLASTTTNADAGSWSAPTLKTASYNITSGGTYYIKETSNSNNIYIYAFSATAEVPCDETAPTFVSSVPANGATGVATSGTIVLTFSEALGSVDASKFTLTGATKGAVAIDGSDATKVNIAYSGAAEEATVTLATAAAAVSDMAGNALAAALSNISFTTASVDPDPEPGDCEELFAGSATSTSEFTTPVGSATTALSSGNSFSAGGYSYSVKPNSSNAIVASPKDGGSFAVGDSLIVVVYNNQSGDKTMGFKLGSGTYTTSVGSKKLHIFRQVLVASDISAGKVTFNRQSSDDRWVEIIIKHCGLLPSCTTPVLSDLTNQKVCPGEDVSWTAIVNNTEDLQDGEMIAYQWTKKGNATILSETATLTLENVTEATGGTYVVTATVSAEGKASATATKEVTLTVTPATATPTITASVNTIFAGNSVTLTAFCASSGVTYQWYTCNDAESNGESAIDNADAAAYTLTADAAGTYYYKVIVTGDGTHSCGTAEKVYTLVVSASNSGETTCGEITGQFTSGAYTFDTDFIIYGINSGGNLDAGASSSSGNSRCGGSGSYFGKQRFVVTFPVDVLSFSFIGYQSNLRTVEAVKTTTDLKTADTEYTNITHTAEASQEGDCQTHVITPETAIPANTFVWVELNNGLNISEICYVPVSTADCTDPQVTATVDNATICAGTESTVTFTATNYADGAEFQWQKKDGNTWTNINGAISDTYIIPSVTTENTGKYRVIAEAGCKRISEEVTLTVLTAPEFNAFANTASVMKGNALTINDVEATNATDYTWYKSADATYDAGTDTKVGTTKELLLAASSITEEADQIFYLFCVASNSCGSDTSNVITVTVTPFVEEECATAGNEGEHEFGFTNTSCSQGTYSETAVWTTNSRSKYLTYTAPEGKYFKTAKVTVAVTSGSKCGYAYSTDGGTTWTYAELTSLSSTLTEKTINLSALGGGVIDAFRISRNLQDGGGTDHGVTSGNFHLSKACFEYADACTETTLAVGSYNNEHNISTNMDFVEPTFTLKAGETPLENQTLTYTSSNPAIATVDEDGNVTFEGMTGKVTITVAFAGATINETEYCACQGSYTITVGCTDQAPTIKAATGTNLNGCNTSIILEAKMQDGTTAFADGTFQWYRDGEAIDGATSASYEVVRAGTYTVSRTYTCTTMSSNSAVVTNENPEPKVERLTPFQYYHVNKTYSNQMKDRHLFAVTSYGTLDGGKRYHLTATRNGQTLDLSSSTAFFTISSSDNAVDTVMIDLNELEGKYNANDEIVITCAPINNCNQVSTITSSITIHVIDQTPTLALICSGANGDGTRNTDKLVVGGDFLTGYNKADLCQQTGNTTFDPNTEWGFYTLLKEDYIVTPVNGYAQFNKLNYEPFDILLLTDYPKSSKDEAAQKIIDDMAELCDYRPLLSFKTHFQSDKWKDKTTGEYKYTKWVKKGFTTAPVVPAQSALYADIVCYAHPMFSNINNTSYTYHNDADHDQLIYKILDRAGYEKKNKIAKGIQGFELADASNFVTIGLIHNDASAAEVDHTDADFNGDGIVDEKDIHKHVQWTNGENDRKLVAIAERQANVEARMILFSINCGAQSLQTEGGRQVILQCLKYLYNAENLIEPAECHLTFDNKHGDHKWSNHLNWAPRYEVCPTENDEVRIAAPCTVDIPDASVLSVQILEGGSLTINQGAALVVAGPITRFDKETDISSATESEDILIGSDDKGNGTLIFSNANGTTKATVKMYSTAKADMVNMSAATSTWQYIGTPHSDVQNAADNYYESWLYQYDTGKEGWVVIPNGGPLVPFRGYCVTHPENPHTYTMTGTLTATTNQDITIPEGKFVVVANSWTAPIQVANFEDDDLENLTDKTVYLFNTGSDPEGDGTITPDSSATQETRYATGTYISIPIHSASYTGDATISSMQGFYVVGGGAEGTLHLNYDKLVRPKEEQNIIGGPMHAPARITDTDNEPQVAKFLFRGTRYDDRLIILERPDFTRGYDSGWDGEQWGGNAAAPMSYVVAETRYDAVSAIPEYEGTVIGFRAGEDNIYTIYFDYDGMEEALYLLDTETKIYTRVLKGNSYTFACPDKAEHNRFILTRKAPQIATSTENINTGENAKAVKFIKDDKIFIFVNGMLYDATGKMVVR